MGRPKIEFTQETWKQLEDMAQIFCTGEEMASIIGVSFDTLEKRVKETHGISFTEWFDQKSSGGRKSLRRAQFHLAKKNAAMGIWLGKQYLGQKDQMEVDQRQTTININYSKDDLNQAIEDAKRIKNEGQE